MEASENMETGKFKCEICEKSFSTKGSKKLHITAVHGEVNIFACNVCSKTFREKKNLTSHIKNLHNEGPKKHKCESCEKSFTHGGGLKYQRHFMKYKEITNVILVGNHSLDHNI